MSFKEVNPVINAYMQKSPIHMMDGIMFVQLTIQRPFAQMFNDMQDYRKYGLASRHVWGNKKTCMEWLLENREQLYRDLMIWWESDSSKADKDREMMRILVDVPGLGLAKAGFVMQMMFGRVGCIDVHNLRRFYKVKPQDIAFAKSATDKTKYKKIENYVNICKGNRSTEKLWDSWCEQLVDKKCNKRAFSSGFEVSLFHLEALVGKRV